MADPLPALVRRRDYECRLTPDRALDSLSEAHAFLQDRGLLTRTADCALPSLYAACHEEPIQVGGRGFASWPATKWPWAHQLAELPGVLSLDVHQGKTMLLWDDVAALADPVCRAELARMGAADAGCAKLLAHLASSGPSLADDVEVELGLTRKAFKALRLPLQRCGAIVARSVVLPARSGEGHIHRSELARWDQVYPRPSGLPLDMVALMGRTLRAAVLAPEKDLVRWFSWRSLLPADLAGQLLERGLATRPAPGWLAAPA
ncbi:MAG TPA: hypothetical protein VMB74_06600 [Streptosporangiaceae bacterium]|nr:hypothetical protein [Streptosporangiaceae bacterium]